MSEKEQPHRDHTHSHEESHGHDHDHPHPHDDTSSDAARAPVEHDHSHPHPRSDDHAASPGHSHGSGDHGHEQAHHTGLRGFIEELIRPHTHDTADRVDTAMESSSLGVRALKISLAVMLVTAVLQAVVVVMSGSIALLADTIHNFADALTSVPLWIAFVLGRRAADRRYTYGYGRAEDVAGVVIVLIIFGSAVLAAWEAFQKILSAEPMTNIGYVAAASIIGFLGNELVALYRIRTGQRIGSAALVADGYHARGDGLTSLAVLIGVVGTLLGYPIIDPLVGIGISIAILLITKNAAISIWHRVMDAVDPLFIERLERVASSVPGVQGVEDVRARWLGHRLEADLRIIVDCDLRTADSHAIAEHVRHALFHVEPKLASIVVHTDPCGHDGQDHHVVTAGHTRRSVNTRAT